MRVPCYICEEDKCFSTFFEKICKTCAMRLSYRPEPTNKADVIAARQEVYSHRVSLIRQQEYAEC